ncbi:phosphoglycerate mutase family protein [Candidatus Poriferisocius sp.]|uniref:phosphoglycerate mutase family protein n=1 Tax=Candidatus Poriferisocius sp. TaxID=3101276 RepID=UPI003B5B3DF3
MSPKGGRTVRVILLRHGQVAHHRSDVGLTDLGVAQSEAAGRWFAEQGVEIECLLSGETARTLDTATAFAAGYRGVAGSPELPEPVVGFALRNPDLYLGGHRVNIAEGAEAIAAQAPGISPEDVVSSPFFGKLISAEERVGYWLEHPNPPGEDAHAVAWRVVSFVRSLGDGAGRAGATVVAITHSPVLRAVRLGFENVYTREPPFLHGFSLIAGRTGDITFSLFETDTGDIPATSKPGPGLEES